MRNRLGRMEAFDALLEELATEVLSSGAAAPAASNRHPEVRYAVARMPRAPISHPADPSLPCATGHEAADV